MRPASQRVRYSMGTQPPGDYEPHTAPKQPAKDETEHITVSVYRCPACKHVCRPRDLDPLLDKLCPKCFRAAVAKVVPEMDAMTVMVPKDPATTAIEPKPGTTAHVAASLNRGDELHIETERMEKHETYRRDKRTGRTVATTRYRAKKSTGDTTGKTTKAKTRKRKS